MNDRPVTQRFVSSGKWQSLLQSASSEALDAKVRGDRGPGAFAELLRQHRIAAGLSQESLAERAGISRKAIASLEQGVRRAPYHATVKSLGRALLLSTRDLADFEAAASKARTRAAPVQAATDFSHTLPAQVTSFVGRQRDIDALSELLLRHRIVTVTGSGGIGKTRLALETATRAMQHYPDGACFVDLSATADLRSVVRKTGSVVRISIDEGELVASLTESLRPRRMLIVMDNCEQVVAAAGTVAAAILETCRDIRILATSRQRLSLSGEAPYRVGTLGVPALTSSVTSAILHSYDSVRLFVDRAQTVDRSFALNDDNAPAVAEICRSLDGIPLAIEIAAARIRTVGLTRIGIEFGKFAELSSRFIDTPPRHQTLKATIEWSHAMLDEPERALFRRLSVFVGGLSASAAQAVCAGGALATGQIPELLESLVEKSMVTAEYIDSRERYLLLETMREFAYRQLEASGEMATTVAAHAAWISAFADNARLRLGAATRSRRHSEIALEFDNMNAAIGRMLEPGGNVAVAGSILGRLYDHWFWFGRAGDAMQLADAILARLDPVRHPTLAGQLELARANALEGPAKLNAARKATALFTAAKDATWLARSYLHEAYALQRLGKLSRAAKALGLAWTFAARATLFENSIYLGVLLFRGKIQVGLGDLVRAQGTYEFGIAESVRYGDELSELAMRIAIAELHFIAGDAARSFEQFRDLAEQASLFPTYALYLKLCLASCYISLGDASSASAEARFVLLNADGKAAFVLEALTLLAHATALEGDAASAARVIGFVDAQLGAQGSRRDPFDLARYESLMRLLRTRLGHESLALHGAEGAATGLETTIDAVLGDQRPSDASATSP